MFRSFLGWRRICSCCRSNWCGQSREGRFFSLPALLCTLLTAAVVLAVRMFGPSYFVSAAFAVVMSVIVYLAVCRLRRGGGGGLIDCCLLLCVGLQLLLYVVSDFMQDFIRFNLYFAVDITLTFSFVALLPLALREVAEK